LREHPGSLRHEAIAATILQRKCLILHCNRTAQKLRQAAPATARIGHRLVFPLFAQTAASSGNAQQARGRLRAALRLRRASIGDRCFARVRRVLGF